MKTRIISGIVLGILVVAAMYLGGPLLYLFCAVASFVGMFELYRIFEIQNKAPGIIGYLMAFVFYLNLSQGGDRQIEAVLLIAGLMALMTLYVLKFPAFKTEQIVIAFFGVIYVAVMLSYIYRCRMEELGFYYSWIIWAGSWVNDTFAYFTGMAFGKHKMAKVLSPKKTIEGAIGGIVMTTIIATVFGYFLNTLAHIDQPEMPLVFMAAGAISSLLGIIGDLSASAIKRNHNIKDYGKLIPGHGGILDRFDSVIFTAPAVYWSVALLSQIFH